MPRNESFDFAGPAGRLEAILMEAEPPARAAAVVCHAHPLHGGIMHFKVVFRAAKALQRAGVAALRFNFRGVGRSEGSHDHGNGEQEDVLAALDEVERRFPALPLLVAGFSFGSVMALLAAARDPRPRAAIALGLPLSTMGDSSVLEKLRAPLLFVQGERDGFGDGASLKARLEPLPASRTLRVVPGADHFFAGHLDALERAVGEWAAGGPWRDGG